MHKYITHITMTYKYITHITMTYKYIHKNTSFLCLSLFKKNHPTPYGISFGTLLDTRIMFRYCQRRKKKIWRIHLLYQVIANNFLWSLVLTVGEHFTSSSSCVKKKNDSKWMRRFKEKRMNRKKEEDKKGREREWRKWSKQVNGD